MPDFDLDTALSAPKLESGPPPRPLSDLMNLATGRAAGDPTPHTGEVFFYAEGGLDWRPVKEFKKCKVFVYCDVHSVGPTAAAALSSLFKKGKPPTTPGKFVCKHLKRWSQEWRDDFLGWEQRANAFMNSLWPDPNQARGGVLPANNAQGRMARGSAWTADIKRTFVDGQSDTVKIIYLPVSGLAGYLRLYFRDAVAPHAICLPESLPSHSLETFGRVLQIDHAAHESLLLLPSGAAPASQYLEDWHFMSREFFGWDRVAYTTKARRLCHLL